MTKDLTPEERSLVTSLAQHVTRFSFPWAEEPDRRVLTVEPAGRHHPGLWMIREGTGFYRDGGMYHFGDADLLPLTGALSVAQQMAADLRREHEAGVKEMEDLIAQARAVIGDGYPTGTWRTPLAEGDICLTITTVGRQNMSVMVRIFIYPDPIDLQQDERFQAARRDITDRFRRAGWDAGPHSTGVKARPARTVPLCEDS